VASVGVGLWEVGWTVFVGLGSVGPSDTWAQYVDGMFLWLAI
jgi:hypothetical protein